MTWLVTWLVDLASAIGLPTGGAAVAACLYYGSIAAEKEARPEALKDIARILKNTSWAAGNQPQVFIYRIFCVTFGERQFSVKCIVRSIASSIIYLTIVCLLSSIIQNTPIYMGVVYNMSGIGDLGTVLYKAWYLGLLLVIVTFIPDYISLWKARSIVKRISESNNALIVVIMVAIDIAISIGIAFIAMIVYRIVFLIFIDVFMGQTFHTYWYYSWFTIKQSALIAYGSFKDIFLMIFSNSSRWTDTDLFITSTLLTSIWAIFALISSVIAKGLMVADYTRRGTSWFFDVDKHPIRALGIVAGGLIFVLSLIITFIQAL